MKVVLELQDQMSNVRKITVRHDIVIGRGADCNLRLSAPQISRRHCFLRVGRDGVSVTDLDSSNGTWVEGRRIDSGVRCEVVDGSFLSLGPIRFLVHVRAETVSSDLLPSGVLSEDLLDVSSNSTAPSNGPQRSDAPLGSTPRPNYPAPLPMADSRAEIVDLGLRLSALEESEQFAVPPAAPGVAPLTVAGPAIPVGNTVALPNPDSVDILQAGLLTSAKAQQPAVSNETTSLDLQSPALALVQDAFLAASRSATDASAPLQEPATAGQTVSDDETQSGDIEPELRKFLRGL
jgi:predicted component of type VI protein secretion system